MKTFKISSKSLVLLAASMALGVAFTSAAISAHRAAERERMFASLPTSTLPLVVVIGHRPVAAAAAPAAAS